MRIRPSLIQMIERMIKTGPESDIYVLLFEIWDALGKVRGHLFCVIANLANFSDLNVFMSQVCETIEL
jgi:hypothetical protein